jgi:hypothetical protein
VASFQAFGFNPTGWNADSIADKIKGAGANEGQRITAVVFLLALVLGRLEFSIISQILHGDLQDADQDTP